MLYAILVIFSLMVVSAYFFVRARRLKKRNSFLVSEIRNTTQYILKIAADMEARKKSDEELCYMIDEASARIENITVSLGNGALLKG